MRARKGEAQAFVNEVATHQGIACIDWPFAKTLRGYGIVRGGHAHTRVCRIVHGPRPTAEHTDAAHSCGNPGCVNPAHLRWATPAENQNDKIAHGTSLRGEKNPQARLTAGGVEDIRARRGAGATLRELAEAYEVSQQTIHNVVAGKKWRH